MTGDPFVFRDGIPDDYGGDWLDEHAEKRMGLTPAPTERLCPDCYTWHAGSECF